jgi:hypothetical protein
VGYELVAAGILIMAWAKITEGALGEPAAEGARSGSVVATRLGLLHLELERHGLAMRGPLHTAGNGQAQWST